MNVDFINLKLKPAEPSILATEQESLTEVEVEKIQGVISSMSNLEKAVVVRKIPTEILQNEISRRLKRDKADLRSIKAIIGSMEEY